MVLTPEEATTDMRNWKFCGFEPEYRAASLGLPDWTSVDYQPSFCWRYMPEPTNDCGSDDFVETVDAPMEIQPPPEFPNTCAILHPSLATIMCVNPYQELVHMIVNEDKSAFQEWVRTCRDSNMHNGRYFNLKICGHKVVVPPIEKRLEDNINDSFSIVSTDTGDLVVYEKVKGVEMVHSIASRYAFFKEDVHRFTGVLSRVAGFLKQTKAGLQS